jgi:hypothetical protein
MVDARSSQHRLPCRDNWQHGGNWCQFIFVDILWARPETRGWNWCQFIFVDILWARPETRWHGTGTAHRRGRPRLSCPQWYGVVAGYAADWTERMAERPGIELNPAPGRVHRMTPIIDTNYPPYQSSYIIAFARYIAANCA